MTRSVTSQLLSHDADGHCSRGVSICGSRRHETDFGDTGITDIERGAFFRRLQVFLDDQDSALTIHDRR